MAITPQCQQRNDNLDHAPAFTASRPVARLSHDRNGKPLIQRALLVVTAQSAWKSDGQSVTGTRQIGPGPQRSDEKDTHGKQRCHL